MNFWKYLVVFLVSMVPIVELRGSMGFALSNEFIILLKDTSMITVIGGKELLDAAQGIYNRTYEQMFPLIGIAVIYLILVMIFSWLQSILERRLRQSDRR